MYKGLLPLLVAGLLLTACGDDDSTTTPDASPMMDGMMMGGDAAPMGAEILVENEITEDTTWSSENTYVLADKIFVTGGATLTIEAGTSILGESGSALLVTRGSAINAVGTADAPIVFTSANPEGSRATGDWAGVVLLGSATVNKGSMSADGFLEGQIEGIDATDPRGTYGGNMDTSSCGALQYVRIEFAGEEFSMDNELNGLTVGGCGSGTTLSYIQVHRGSDDGVEFFGGTASIDHVVLTGISDDSLDCDQGWQGLAQFVIVHQYAGVGDNAIECDSTGEGFASTPRTQANIWNATFIGQTDTRGMVLREGVSGSISNLIIQDMGKEPFDVRNAETAALWPTELSISNSHMCNNGNFTSESGEDDDDGSFIETTAIADASLNNSFITGSSCPVDSTAADFETNPSYAPGTALMGATPPIGDTTATFAGAIGDTDWTAGWTAYPAN